MLFGAVLVMLLVIYGMRGGDRAAGAGARAADGGGRREPAAEARRQTIRSGCTGSRNGGSACAITSSGRSAGCRARRRQGVPEQRAAATSSCSTKISPGCAATGINLRAVSERPAVTGTTGRGLRRQKWGALVVATSDDTPRTAEKSG